MRGCLALLLLAGVAFAQGRAGNDTEEEQAFQAGETAFKDGRDDDALKNFERVRALNPQRADAWVKPGVILYKRKQYNDAVALLRAGQKALPADLAIKAQLGLSLYRAGDAADVAVQILDEVVAAKPEAFQVQLQLAQHWVKAGDGKKAAAAVEAYFKYRPTEAAQADAQVRPLAGAAYLLARRWDDAQREFESVLKVSPNDVPARVSLGHVFTAKGEHSKAITLYERLGGEAARQPSIHYNLGTCYLKVGRRVEAERSALAYTAARPKDAKGFVLLGDARAENRDAPGALAAYEQARKIDPSPAVAARIGKAHIAQKNYPAAIAMLEQAAAARAAANEGDLEIQTQLAEAYAETRQPREKLLAVGERLATAKDADALAAAGLAFYAAASDARAERAFAAALEIDPKARRARSGLQMALQRLAAAALAKDDLAAAESALVRAQKLDPESVQTSRNLGLTLLLAKKYADAEKALQVAYKKVPRDLVVNRLLGRAWLGLKRQGDAIRAWETAAQVAQRTRGPALAEVYAELGPAYLEAGRVDEAITVLDTAVKEAGQTAALSPSLRNLAIALYRRGLGRLRDRAQAEAAFEDLDRAAQTPQSPPKAPLAAKEHAQVMCAAALAALGAGKPERAIEWLGRVAKEGCALRAPYDKAGLEFFVAYAQYRDPGRREAAAKTFSRLAAKAAGPLANVLRDLVRSSYELDGYDAWARGDEKGAALRLRTAARLTTKGERRELDHNLAVIDMTEGRYVAAEKLFEELGPRPPEALVNLGILVDRQGDPKRALDLYKKAADRGARAPKLREWIDVKERLMAGGAK